MMSGSEKGRNGEELCSKYLLESGYEILERNFTGIGGEIDIIAKIGDTIVFIEVKAWKTLGFRDLEYAINHRKQKRIIRVSKFYLCAHRELEDMVVRYDVIFVSLSDGSISHIEDAFMEM